MNMTRRIQLQPRGVTLTISNWLCEYKIIQDVFKKYEHKFNYWIIPFTKDDPNPAQYN